MDVPTIKRLLKEYHVAPHKMFGQHFLINELALSEVINIAGVSTYDTILEIGPGLGALTRKLVARANKVIAVEIDKGFVQILEREFAGQKRLKIVHQDILRFALPRLKRYKVVGNLPYNASAQILEKFLPARTYRPSSLTITVQKEFALRLGAKRGDANRLSLFVQYYSKPRIVAHFPPNYFWPQPKVHSSLVQIDLYQPGQFPLLPDQEQYLWQLVKTAFSQARKKLRNSLGLEGEFGDKRPEELGLEEWIALAKPNIKNYKPKAQIKM